MCRDAAATFEPSVLRSSAWARTCCGLEHSVSTWAAPSAAVARGNAAVVEWALQRQPPEDRARFRASRRWEALRSAVVTTDGGAFDGAAVSLAAAGGADTLEAVCPVAVVGARNDVAAPPPETLPPEIVTPDGPASDPVQGAGGSFTLGTAVLLGAAELLRRRMRATQDEDA